MTSADVVFNPLLPEFHANPYPFYRRLREADPVHLSTFGTWILTRYDDAVMVLRDPRFGREIMGDMMEARFGGTEERPAYSRSMLFRDPPDHTRLPRERALSARSAAGRAALAPAYRPPLRSG